MSVQLSNKELDYSSVMKSNPQYKFRKISPDQAQPTLSLSATTSSSFSFPASNVVNYSKSVLTFQIVLALQADDFVNMKTACLAPIQGLRLTTERGVVLVDVQDIPQFTQCAWHACTTEDEFHNMSKFTSGAPSYLLIRSQTTDALSPVILETSTSASDVRSYSNSQDFVSSGADATALTVLVNIPMSMIYHTFLAEKSDIYLPEAMTLDITWASLNDYCFDSDNLALANSGQLVAGAMTASTLYFYLAVQSNEDIIQAVKQKTLNEGLNLVTQFVSVYKELTGAGTSYSKSWKVSATRGNDLLRCYHVLDNHTASSSLVRNINNRANSKWSVVRLYTNNVPHSDYALTANEFYIQNKDVYHESLIACQEQFRDRPVIVRDFSGLGPQLKDVRARGGKDLLSEQLDLGIEFTKTADDYNHFMFVVTNRMVTINKEGISKDG